MKSRLLIPLLLILTFLLMFSACNSSKYKDGVYTAQSAEFASSGWKDTLELTISNGRITKINWDSIYKNDSIPIRKKQYSKSGMYGMLAAGAIDEWYDQAIAVEQFVLEYGIDALILKDDGFTDAVSGCTIHVNEFDKLLRECLQKASVS